MSGVCKRGTTECHGWAAVLAGALAWLLAFPSGEACGRSEVLHLAAAILTQPSKLDQEEEEPSAPKRSAKPASGLKPGKPPEIEGDQEEKPVPKRSPVRRPVAKPGGAASGAKAPRSQEKPAGEASPATKPTEESPPQEDVCDRLYWRSGERGGGWIKIQLCIEELSLPLPSDEKFTFNRYPSGSQAIPGDEVQQIDYYEEWMLEQAAQLVRLTPKELATLGTMVDLSQPSRVQRAQRAEAHLQAALAEHDSAVQRGRRQSVAFNERLRLPLVHARANLRLSQIDFLLAQKDENGAKNECDRLTAELPSDDPALAHVYQRLERIYAAGAEEALAAGNYARVRDLLDEVSGRSPHPGMFGPALERVHDTLISRATELVREADQLKAASPQQAMERLEAAAAIWPRLAELDRARRGLHQDYPVLRCAYPELPRSLCPLWVRTPVERHAVSLVCEGLVRWVDDDAGAHYLPQLAQGRPWPLAKGRAFQLPRCLWPPLELPGSPGAGNAGGDRSVAYPCTAEDVRRTVAILRNPDVQGYSPVLGRLLDRVEEGDGGDHTTARIYLNSDHWQPLSLMSFQVFPHHFFSAAGSPLELEGRLREFGRNPVGTGPYRLAAEDHDNPVRRRFVANPYYRVPGLPRIQEIQFERHEPTKAVEAFLQGKLDLIYGVQKEHVNQLVQQGKKVVTLPTPVVSLLAPNYRRKLPSNEYFRLAVAHGIDRNEILRQHFRAGRGGGDHAPLNGPYPRNSWACNRQVSDFDPQKARGYAAQAEQALKTDLAVQLLYPAGQEDIENACTAMARQLKGAGITLNLVKADPDKFRDQVVVAQDFDLAYWAYCYPDATYWIGPLVEREPAGRPGNGWNVMNYTPDEDLERLLRGVAEHKCFRDIEEATHKIHEHVARKAIFIPLWQLDAYVAVGDRLQHVANRLDPLVLFAGVERWTLEAPR